MTPAPDIDEVAVARAMHGGRVELHPQERREVVRRLRERGMNNGEIARQTGVSEKTVDRHAKALGLPPVPPRHYARIPHIGVRAEVLELTREIHVDNALDGFFGDPFNRLLKDTFGEQGAPCAGRWDIFTDLTLRAGATKVEVREHRRAIREARAVCAGCPIAAECLERGLQSGPQEGPPTETGIWGGFTERERVRIWRDRQTAREVAS